MTTLIIKRVTMAIPSLVGVVIVTFLLTRMLAGDPGGACQTWPGQAAGTAIRPLPARSRSRQSRHLAYDRPACRDGVANPFASFGGTNSTWSFALDLNRRPTRHPGRHATEFATRSHLPPRIHGGGIAAGVFHRPDPDLCLLLPAWLGPGAARTAGRFLPRAAPSHWLLSDRQPDRGRSSGVYGGAQATRPSSLNTRRVFAGACRAHDARFNARGTVIGFYPHRPRQRSVQLDGRHYLRVPQCHAAGNLDVRHGIFVPAWRERVG